MKKWLYIVACTVLCAMLLSGCQKETTIIGKWVDDTGYHIQFFDNGTFREDTFGTLLKYTADSNHVVYAWGDGYSRSSPLSYPDKGSMTMQISGAVRNFKSTKEEPVAVDWNLEELPVGTTTEGRFTLLGSSGIQSEVRLLSNNFFALSWGDAEATLDNWKVASPTCVLGKYIDRGPGQSLVLYTGDDVGTVQYEQFVESSNGEYVAAYPLEGDTFRLEEDWNSPVNWKGYLIDCRVSDENTMVHYVFSKDNTVIKELSDGTTILYAYYIDKDGLITLSCLDGFLDSDTMWLDIAHNKLYRMVYKRDSWTDYMHAIAIADKSTTIAETSSNNRVMDANLLTNVALVESQLLGGYGSALTNLYKTFGETDSEKASADFLHMKESQEYLASELLSREELAAQREKEKKEFLAEMGVLAEQKRIADAQAEQAVQEDMLAQGYTYDPTTGSWYIPGTVTTGTIGEDGQPRLDPSSTGGIPVDPSTLPSPQHFGGTGSSAPPSTPTIAGGTSTETVTVPGTSMQGQTPDTTTQGQIPVQEEEPQKLDVPANATVAEVKYHCNCATCHTDDYPVAKGVTNVALVNPSYWAPGEAVILGDTVGSPQVTFVDSDGGVTDMEIHAYFADHGWVQAQSDGTYTVIPVGG